MDNLNQALPDNSQNTNRSGTNQNKKDRGKFWLIWGFLFVLVVLIALGAYWLGMQNANSGESSQTSSSSSSSTTSESSSSIASTSSSSQSSTSSEESDNLESFEVELESPFYNYDTNEAETKVYTVTFMAPGGTTYETNTFGELTITSGENLLVLQPTYEGIPFPIASEPVNIDYVQVNEGLYRITLEGSDLFYISQIMTGEDCNYLASHPDVCGIATLYIDGIGFYASCTVTTEADAVKCDDIMKTVSAELRQ